MIQPLECIDRLYLGIECTAQTILSAVLLKKRVVAQWSNLMVVFQSQKVSSSTHLKQVRR
jgi:hypothetical protein